MAIASRKIGKRLLRKDLLAAIKKHDVARVSQLVDDYPYLADAPNSHGNTPLSVAVSAKDFAIVKVLVSAGATSDHKNQGGFGLIDAAAWSGSTEIALYLVEHGCSLTVNHAAALGMLSFVREALQKDARAAVAGNRHGTPVHFAAHGNHVDVLELLLAAGADIRARNHHGHEPIALATEATSKDAVNWLLENGADPNVLGGHSGAPILHRAILTKNIDIVRALLDAGAEPNKPGVANKTALHEAVGTAKLEVVDCVLAYQVDLSIRTQPTRLQKGNETALEYARRLGKQRIVSLLENRVERD